VLLTHIFIIGLVGSIFPPLRSFGNRQGLALVRCPLTVLPELNNELLAARLLDQG
jgi:hypothetical protein